MSAGSWGACAVSLARLIYRLTCASSARPAKLGEASAITASLDFGIDGHHLRKAAIDVGDLARDARGQVGQQEGGRVAHLFDGDVAPQRGDASS